MPCSSRNLSFLAILIFISCLWYLYRRRPADYLIEVMVFQDSHHNVHKDQGEGIVKMDGSVLCDRSTLICNFENLYYNPMEDQFYLSIGRESNDLVSLSTGTLIQPGIGSPSSYYYLDTWTFNVDNNNTRIIQARSMLEMERSYTPGRPLKPIYILNGRLFDDSTDIITIPVIFYYVLWPLNYFRMAYTGAALVYSLLEQEVLSRDLQLIQLDQHSDNPFSNLHQAISPSFSIKVLKDFKKPVIFKHATFGISRNGLLPETEFAFTDFRTSLRSTAYRMYGSLLKKFLLDQSKFDATAKDSTWKVLSSTRLIGPSKAPRIILVERKDDKRGILNQIDLVNLIRDYNVSLDVIVFEEYPLAEQVKIASSADIMISAHGAALTNVLFMRQGSVVIEIFPFGFKKTIYRNLAQLVGVQYASWQCPRRSCSVNVNTIRAEKLINWDDITSKEYWRNQAINIDLVEFRRTFDLALKFLRHRQVDEINIRDKVNEKYLMYLPWEQFNNQIVGFKSACAVSSLLNRTLVLPPFGYRKKFPKEVEDERKHTAWFFKPTDYEWHPITRYFDNEALEGLPCRIVPFEGFVELTRKVGSLILRRLGQSKRVSNRQLMDYYYHIATLEYDKLGALPSYAPVYFERKDVEKFLLRRYDHVKTLCLGTMFWFFPFDGPLDYPLRSFQSKMQSSLYRSITIGLKFHNELQRLVDLMLDGLGTFNSLHLRRGDYLQKCFDEGMGASDDEHYRQSCYQRPIYLYKRIRKVQKQQLTRSIPWFISTNEDNLSGLISSFKKAEITILTTRDISKRFLEGNTDVLLGEMLVLADGIEKSIIDQLICVKSKRFIGNFFSSFTRTIVELRELEERESDFF